jgi:hypothetical protein
MLSYTELKAEIWYRIARRKVFKSWHKCFFRQHFRSSDNVKIKISNTLYFSNESPVKATENLKKEDSAWKNIWTSEGERKGYK